MTRDAFGNDPLDFRPATPFQAHQLARLAGLERALGELHAKIDRIANDLKPTSGWRAMHSAPRDGTELIGRYGDQEIRIRWSEQRVCMLAPVAAGAGQLGEGWEDVCNQLYIDAPEAWKPVAGAGA
ncbi:hypothetical protein [Amycolatopsis thermoflava]|uniref:hypothetical protein n=1 Tax=Amycolatopsis thermoflava TaxID=84480 RepID=UPI00040D147D|nr:hypothetical protein [Amycolatopsis thermoflava]